MSELPTTNRRLAAWALLGGLWLACAAMVLVPAQPTMAQAVQGSDAVRSGNANDPPREEANTSGGAAMVGEGEEINFFLLIVSGGWLMIPIGMMSLLTVTIFIERMIALRRGRVLPEMLVKELGRLGGSQGSFDPREAYRVCQRYPSAASTVVRAMLLKVGRPHSEVEHTVAEASEREADRLYSNVRWLNLAAAVTPLIGLLGTVWGMIDAFHRTTLLAPGQNKADELATGIYIALVTTLGGLMVAIPAAICSHFFEGRIGRLFHEINEMLFNLLPQIERFEGRMRFGLQPGDGQRRAAAGHSHAAEPPVRG
ncbi:MAG: MotA/TolQ/ExbB proton channel family protein [Planctomycetes bacterium]|nr:MotA/TolQ/ExbB proton channel family protein [Planctomycetota bacterium]